MKTRFTSAGFLLILPLLIIVSLVKECAIVAWEVLTEIPYAYRMCWRGVRTGKRQ
jgi:hypothetical protein